MFCVVMWVATPVTAQQQSVRPGINDAFRDPDVTEFVGKFETESREVFALRKEIVGACELKPGQTVADVGAGTGLFTDLFAEAVGTKGRVIAVDISQKFVDHIREKARAQGRLNIDALLCSADSVELPPESIDVAFICDTYHHFEFPFATMKSLAKAMKPGGVLVVIDFRRIEGVSSAWVLSHVRAGQEVVETEIARSGLVKIAERKNLLKENYFVMFRKNSN
ncbi:MAG: class I SAM-dependent methyltransferase [Planctomycetales bacterium]|nr:class I SAM-dependent methyltransferase [Planctomycetales bacterium]